MTTSRVLYGGEETNIDLVSQPAAYEYIQSSIIKQNMMLNDTTLINETSFFKITKNNKIKTMIESLEKVNSKVNNDILCLYAYGSHIQKFLSVIEIYKSKILKDTEYRQWNRLTSFEVVSPGKNELLDKKTKVPIIVSFITTNKKYFDHALFIAENNAFTEQKSNSK